MEKITWKFVCHITLTNCYLRTDRANLDGVDLYRHVQTNRDSIGLPTESVKVFFSDGIDGAKMSAGEAKELVISSQEKVSGDEA